MLTNHTDDSIGSLNPIRYRSYYNDTDIYLYYLQSRYYDPVACRFINADGQLNGGFLGNNLFAYCENNPVMRVDNDGAFWDTVFDVVSLCFSCVDVVYNYDDSCAWLGLLADVASLALPFVACGGIIVDVATKSDEVVDFFKFFDNSTEFADTASDIGKTADNFSDVSGVVGDTTRGIDNTVNNLDNLRVQQKALSQLGKEIEKNARNGIFISYEEALIFDEWCKFYGIPQHHGAQIGSGKHWITGWDHTHFYGRHIPFK